VFVDEFHDLVIKAIDPSAALAERHYAFERLVLRFQDMAFACAYAILGDFHLAEDAAQEAFITAWRKLQQLRKAEAFPGWFKQILLNSCYRLQRGKRPQTIWLSPEIAAPSDKDSPQTKLERRELKTAVYSAIERLPKNERMVIALFYLNEKSQRDISSFLEVPMTTVAKRLYSARNRLRGKMMDRFKSDLASNRPSRDKTFAEKVRAGIYDEYVGQYQFELRPELVVSIRRERNKLFCEGGGQTNLLFSYDGTEDELLVKEFDGKGRFVRDSRGQITHLVYYEFGAEKGIAKKIIC
jgi:RNA polymerase sigma factor (sigma-70 family)